MAEALQEKWRGCESRDDVLKAATGHVIGKGELVGTYRQEVKPPK